MTCKYCGWIHSDWLSCDQAKARGEVSFKIEPPKTADVAPVQTASVMQTASVKEQKKLTQSEKMKLYWQKKKENRITS